MDEALWELILKRIEGKRFVPFLGAGACQGFLPNGSELSAALAKKYSYPFPDSDNLLRVSQFGAVLGFDGLAPKFDALELLELPREFTTRDKIPATHSLLAKLPFPLYLTTNYDDYLGEALRRNYRDPKLRICRWCKFVDRELPADPPESELRLIPGAPVIYHLHGSDTFASSLVLTEDDYLAFLTAMAGKKDFIPRSIHRALVGSSFLFLGYSLSDWNFLIFFRGLRDLGTVGNLAVMPDRFGTDESAKIKKKFYESRFEALGVNVVWATAEQFCEELASRWSNRL